MDSNGENFLLLHLTLGINYQELSWKLFDSSHQVPGEKPALSRSKNAQVYRDLVEGYKKPCCLSYSFFIEKSAIDTRPTHIPTNLGWLQDINCATSKIATNP